MSAQSSDEHARWVGMVVATAGVAGAVGVVGAAAGAGLMTLLKHQASIAREIIGKPFEESGPPKADRVYKRSYATEGQEPINLLILGDSIAAGLGAETKGGTLGARLAKATAKATLRPVRLRTGAVVGAETSAVPGQIDKLPARYRPDVAVVIVGGNDVTHRVSQKESVRHLVEVIETLRERGAEVVVGTCPDVGAVRPLPQPLRSLGRRMARQLAAAQREAALAAGAHVVTLADVVGPFFITNPDEMFSIDHFHPSAVGYKRTAKAILPSVLAALGYREQVPFGHHLPEVHVEGEASAEAEPAESTTDDAPEGADQATGTDPAPDGRDQPGDRETAAVEDS